MKTWRFLQTTRAKVLILGTKTAPQADNKTKAGRSVPMAVPRVFRSLRHLSMLGALLVIVALGWFFYSKLTALDSTLRVQQKQIQALNEKLAARAKTDLLVLQGQCAQQAEREFLSRGFKKGGLDSYRNHYNAKLNTCFILFTSTNTSAMPGTIWINKVLADAYEGKQFGSYLYRVDKIKKSWEVPPFECRVMLPSGEEKVCTSSDEFDALATIYMEEESKPTRNLLSPQTK
jgi:hypothetical protein